MHVDSMPANEGDTGVVEEAEEEQLESLKFL
jgi:hypothetical protein